MFQHLRIQGERRSMPLDDAPGNLKHQRLGVEYSAVEVEDDGLDRRGRHAINRSADWRGTLFLPGGGVSERGYPLAPQLRDDQEPILFAMPGSVRDAYVTRGECGPRLLAMQRTLWQTPCGGGVLLHPFLEVTYRAQCQVHGCPPDRRRVRQWRVANHRANVYNLSAWLPDLPRLACSPSMLQQTRSLAAHVSERAG